MQNRHGHMPSDQRKDQPAEFAKQRPAKINQPGDLFARFLKDLDPKHRKTAAAAISPQQRNKPHSDHQETDRSVARMGRQPQQS